MPFIVPCVSRDILAAAELWLLYCTYEKAQAATEW